jgi:hypothetical protein
MRTALVALVGISMTTVYDDNDSNYWRNTEYSSMVPREELYRYRYSLWNVIRVQVSSRYFRVNIVKPWLVAWIDAFRWS